MTKTCKRTSGTGKIALAIRWIFSDGIG